MIRLSSGSIEFVSVSSRRIERKLISGHTCPNCGIVIRAAFETDQPVTLKFFASATAAHRYAPSYTTQFAANLIGGKPGQVILENAHFYAPKFQAGRPESCRYHQTIYRKDGDPAQLASLVIAFHQRNGWLPENSGELRQVRERLIERIQRDPEVGKQVFEAFLPYLVVANDAVTGGTPAYLLSSTSFGYRVLNNLLSTLDAEHNQSDEAAGNSLVVSDEGW